MVGWLGNHKDGKLVCSKLSPSSKSRRPREGYPLLFEGNDHGAAHRFGKPVHRKHIVISPVFLFGVK